MYRGGYILPKKVFRLGTTKICLLLTLILVLSASSVSFVPVAGSPEEIAQGLSEPLDYAEIVRAVDIEAVKKHVLFFSSFKTRSTGYTGSYESAEYIRSQFVEAGLVNVSYQEFKVAEAIDHGANVTILGIGKTLQIYPLKPNLGAPSTTPPEGLTGRLIYAGKGYLSDFDGSEVEGSIVLLDWDTGIRWVTAASLGAKAVLFLPPTYVPDIAVPRTLLVPFTYPRFVVDEETAEVLMQHLGEQVTVLARTYWENVQGVNVVGFIEGTGSEEERGKVIVLSSYYDSGSIAPSWAPGAMESMGIASLIEYAKWLARNPPRYTVMFVAFSGHHQGLVGAFRFLEDWVYPAYNLTRRAVGARFIGQFNLDLSGGSDAPYVTWLGDFMRTYGGYDDLGDDPFVREYLTDRSIYGDGGVIGEIRQGTGKQYQVIVDAFPWPARYTARPYEATRYEYMFGRGRIYDSEPLTNLVENLGITITTAYDPRFSYERPWDTFDRLTEKDFENLKTQLELTYCILTRILNTKWETLRVWIYYANWHYPPNYARVDVENRKAESANEYWRPVIGQVGFYNTTKAWYEPVPNALVHIRPPIDYVAAFSAGRWTLTAWALTDENGYFEMWGAAASIGGPTAVYAFVYDKDTGVPLYVPDYGIYQYTPPNIYTGGMQIAYYENVRVGWIAVFKAATAVVFDALDPTTFTPPRIYGTAQTLTVIPSAYETAGHTILRQRSSIIFSDPAYSVIFLGFPPGTPSEVVVGSPTVWRYPIAFLVNSTVGGAAAGYTFNFGQQYRFGLSALQFAENVYDVSTSRFDILTQYNPGLISFPEYTQNQRVSELITKAKEAYEGRRYSEAYTYAYEAWRGVKDSYVYSRVNMEDASFAVPILAAFLIPFTIIAEKLMVNFSGRKKVISLVLIMAIIIFAFYFVHPGFRIAASPAMVVIGFSILTLILPIAFITFGGGLSAIKFVRIRIMGKHEIEVARSAMAVWSFGIGVENMRKRKFRTTLVLISLLLMVVAFTNLASIRGIRVVKPAPITGNPLYNGVYVHRAAWGQGIPDLGETIVQILTAKYKGQADVAPRAWVYTDAATSTEGRFGFLLKYGERSTILHAILGMTPDEPKVTGLDMFLSGNGTWLQTGQRYVAILPSSVANQLGVSEPGATITLFTIPIKVIGIISDDFLSVTDLDREAITPLMLNFPGRNPYNVHISTAETMIMPFVDVVQMGGQVASVSVKVQDAAATENVAMEIFNLIPDLFIYASYKGQVFALTKASITTAMGIEAQMIPFVLLALSILSIMLGNVYERIREIGIYAVVGLSPMHVAFMFFAEAITYALVGGILGYVLAMGTNIAVSAMYPGTVIQNMSSSAVIYALLISMLAMIVSSIYPLFKAARLVTPSLERKWRITTKPVGDEWSVPLPFFTTLTEEVEGIIAFLREFFSAHVGESPPDFSLLQMRLEEGEIEEAPYKGMFVDVRIVPYESGVHQTSRILFKRVGERWELIGICRRLSGAPPEWVKLNTRFIDRLRKQILLWRTMTPDEKKRYTDMYSKM